MRPAQLQPRTQPVRKDEAAVLGEILRNQNEELMQKVKVRDLPTIWRHIPTDDLNKASFRQFCNDAVYCGLAAIRFPPQGLYFWVALVVIGAQTQHIEDYLALDCREPDYIFQAVSDSVEVLYQVPWREDFIK
jgi:hypothetical protein